MPQLLFPIKGAVVDTHTPLQKEFISKIRSAA